MKISSFLIALLIAPSSGETININGVEGTLEFTTNTCTNSESLSAQCAVGGGDLCANNKCASTTGSCNDAGDGCEDLMGNTATCEEPVNKCGDVYCGVPPVYENCQCKDNQCYEMKFVPSDGSSNASTGDADVTQSQSDGDTTDNNEGDDVNAVVPQVPDDGTTTDEPVTTTSGGESYTINGVKGKLQFTTDTCKYGTEVQCATASGPLCKNNMCASTTSTCDDATGGCLSLMGKAEACNKPANICGDGYCGVPPVYENCQCKDNQCYEMKFVPSDADVTQTQTDGDTTDNEGDDDDTPGDEGGDCSGCSGVCTSIAGEVTCCKGSIIDNRCTGDSTVTTADGVSTDYGKGENVIGGDTIDDDGVNSSPIMVGSWVVGGAAIITAVVGC